MSLIRPSDPAEPSVHSVNRPNLLERFGSLKSVGPPVITLLIFGFIFHRIPLPKLMEALRGADYPRFLMLMVPNSLFYFAWDTLILTVVIRWFHGPVRYRDLLPVRAASYVVALFNTNAARGTLAIYLKRQLRVPFLQIGSTVLFLLLTEYTHLVAWATFGIVKFGSKETRPLLWVPPVVAVFWLIFLAYARLDITPSRVMQWLAAPKEWSIFRTFKIAALRRYPEIVLLRMPMFFLSLCVHYLAARTFGIRIPFGSMLTFLPVIFMVAALPVTIAHLGTTQAAWLLFFSRYAATSQLLAFSLASHFVFMISRGILGLIFLPKAYGDLFGALPTRQHLQPKSSWVNGSMRE